MTYNFRKSLPIFLLAAATISTSPTIATEQLESAAGVPPKAKKTCMQKFCSAFSGCVRDTEAVIEHQAPNIYLARHLADDELSMLAGRSNNPKIKAVSGILHSVNIVMDGVESVLGINFGAAPDQATLLSAVHTVNSGIEFLDKNQQTIKALRELSSQLSDAKAPQTLEGIAHIIQSLEQDNPMPKAASILANATLEAGTVAPPSSPVVQDA